ncbi:hypothetical protein SAMN05444008_102372 [Cnuella takakiae]|uniref:Phage tail protein n=1 Tax=Cnuella takakiae TaxID=1302690 RepID=A0A1M4VTC9_9BACT|nr:hypothetical protein [Cnuella takakiae]OLY92508.1 hypothetical protein BUE76_11870 [Cnuella takakiae]SHE72110.1 hypothetical protein SAMN05444008_102372 [Cnuella takakiae]
MANYSQGLAKVELAPLAGDGGLGTAFTELGSTSIGSMSIANEQGETTDIFVEEKTDPVISNRTSGAMRVNWEILDVAPDTLVKLFGGTKTGTGTIADPYVYTLPDKIEAKDWTVRLTDSTGIKLLFARLNVFPAFNWVMTKADAGKVTLSGTVLTPTKAGVKAMTITYPGS